MSTTTFGHLSGELSIAIAGTSVSLGYVKVPITGFKDGATLRLHADLAELRDVVQELLNQATESGESA